MKRRIVILALLFTSLNYAQQRITLEDCYALVRKNYPLAQQNQLLEKQHKVDNESVYTASLPQLELDAQATYQSEVITVPLPTSIPLNKDQYRASLSVNQLIYNGKRLDVAAQLKAAHLKTQKKQVDVGLYQLNQQVNQLYYSILLTQEKHALLTAKQALLQAKLKELDAAISHGAVIPSSGKVLTAELLEVSQQFTELASTQAILIETLAALINQPLTTNTIFEQSRVTTNYQGKIQRPEATLFDLKKEELEWTKKLLAKDNAPKVMAFATGGYGNPGLNILDNSFQPFYIVGLKMNWTVFDWNLNKKKQASLTIEKERVDTERQVFNLQIQIALSEQQKEIKKIEKLLISDKEIIRLRKSILATADSQLKNGIITPSAYMVALTNVYESESNYITHSIQLELSKANYNSIKGI